VERFAELGKRLLDDNVFVGVIGYTEAEQEAAERICRIIGEGALPLYGKKGLGRLAALLEKADLFVTNDTGPLHLASAVGTPTVGIYGPTSPDRYGPCRKGKRRPTSGPLRRQRGPSGRPIR